jgi:hypothetical protein
VTRAAEPDSQHAGLGPLHPLSFELAARHPEPRAAIGEAWVRLLNRPRFPLDAGSIGETPFVASRTLIDRLDKRVAELVGWLRPLLSKRDDPAWPLAPAADVLSADLAVVLAPETKEGWDLRWVEIQTFTSLISTIYTLHRGGAELWPELSELAFWDGLAPGRDWLEATRRWMAPEPGSILLETAPWSQPTRPDFEAAQAWFGLTVADTQSVRARAGQLDHCDDAGNWRPVPHVANRIILHEARNRAALEHTLSSVSPGWNSHPAWFYRIDKGVMPELPLAPAERCARADRWRELGLPAAALVAKARHSHSGKGVRLNMDADALDGLETPETWIVQPRFSPAPLLKARDGAPLYGEIRCVIALAKDGEARWLVCRLARLTRNPMTSTSSWTGAAGEGAVPVYAPPEFG